MPGLDGGDHGVQQLRRQDGGCRVALDQRAEHFFHVQPGRAAQPHFGERQQMAARPGQQRHIYAGEVLQQRGQRQHADMLVVRLAAGRGQQGGRDLLQRIGTQAHAFGMPGGAGGVGDFDCPGRQLLGGDVAQAEFAEGLAVQFMRERRIGLDACDRKNFPVLLRLVGEDAIDARVADAVCSLLRREKERQRDDRLAGMQPGQVEDSPERRVVERQPDCLNRRRAQLRTVSFDGGGEFPVAERILFAEQGRGAGLFLAPSGDGIDNGWIHF